MAFGWYCRAPAALLQGALHWAGRAGSGVCLGTAGAAAMAPHSAEPGGAPGYGQSFRNSAFIFPASEPGSARGRLMTHSTPEIIFMGIDP